MEQFQFLDYRNLEKWYGIDLLRASTIELYRLIFNEKSVDMFSP